MEVDDTEVSFFDDLKWKIDVNKLTSIFGIFVTSLITFLAVLSIVQHYVNPPKRLLLPGNEGYLRIARFKLIALSTYLFLYFGYRAEIIYPCCDVVNIHFRTLLPIFDPKIYFFLWTSTVFISRFAQVAFMIKRLEANIRGMWFPSFFSLFMCQISTVGIGILLFILYNHWSNVDIFDADSAQYCSYLEADICNKYAVEEDRRHFHVDFRYIALLRTVNLVHLIVSAIWIVVYTFMMLLTKYDINFMGAIIDQDSLSYERRQKTLNRSASSAFMVFFFHTITSIEVLYFNFPSSKSYSSSTSTFDYTINHVLEQEYFKLLQSENYYHLPHIAGIIRNLRNGRKWNEEVLHPSEDFTQEDYY